MISVTREHSICCGHRVVGHEGKCKHLHGHNYKFVMTLVGDELDELGRVIDFSVIKDVLCAWLEKFWDHKFLVYYLDPDRDKLITIDPDGTVMTSFNPTAENIAQHFCTKVAAGLLEESGVQLVEVIVWETDKCYATYKVNDRNDNTVRDGREDVEAQA